MAHERGGARRTCVLGVSACVDCQVFQPGFH